MNSTFYQTKLAYNLFRFYSMTGLINKRRYYDIYIVTFACNLGDYKLINCCLKNPLSLTIYQVSVDVWSREFTSITAGRGRQQPERVPSLSRIQMEL
jgi:hypothetical protein